MKCSFNKDVFILYISVWVIVIVKPFHFGFYSVNCAKCLYKKVVSSFYQERLDLFWIKMALLSKCNLEAVWSLSSKLLELQNIQNISYFLPLTTQTKNLFVFLTQTFEIKEQVPQGKRSRKRKYIYLFSACFSGAVHKQQKCFYREEDTEKMPRLCLALDCLKGTNFTNKSKFQSNCKKSTFLPAVGDTRTNLIGPLGI